MNDDDLTRDLTRELHDRADTVHGATLGLADVTGRARSIRRRRAATAVVGAAAAVALIVPTAALANHHNGHRTEPGPATQTPTPTQTTDGHQPPRGVLDASDLPTGDAPHLEYVTRGDILHQIDGSTVDIPTRYPVNSFVGLTDGSHIWLTTHHGTPYVEVQDLDGTLHDPVRGGWSLGVNPTHSIAAWVRADGQVMVWTRGATQPLALGDPITAGRDLEVGAVIGDDCSLACSVDVNVKDAQSDSGREVWEASSNGTQQVLDGGYLAVADINQAGLTIGFTKVTDSGTCTKLSGGGEFQGWSTCKSQLESFSPDGRLLEAYPPYYDGLGPTSISMYDLDRHRLFDRRSDDKDQATVTSAQWDDTTHLLASVFQEGMWSLVRIASDGSMEYAVPPVTGEDVANPYVLETGGAALGD